MLIRTTDLSIMGRTWTAILFDDDEFESQHQHGDGITIPKSRQIHFRQSALDIETVRHELFHAYCDGLFLSSARIRQDDFEEIIAEMLGEYLEQMSEKSRAIYQCLKNGS